MKRVLLQKLIVLSIIFLFGWEEIFAQQQSPLGKLFSDILQIVHDIICGRIMAMIITIILPLSAVFFTIAGIRFLIASGDISKIRAEKERIMIVVTALFIIYAVTALVVKAIHNFAPGWLWWC